MSKPTENKVWILWGDSKEQWSEESFDSLEEMNAYLRGCRDAEGWMSFRQFDSEEELKEEMKANGWETWPAKK
jgi:hypothetical protein